MTMELSDYSDAQNWKAWAIGKWVRGRFKVRRVVWGRLAARREKRFDEVILKAAILVEDRA